MRSRLMLIPAAVIAASPAHATSYMTVVEAQQILFPGENLTRDFRRLTAEQVRDIATESASPPIWDSEVNLWKASSGGWFFLDTVIGRDDWVRYTVALDKNGAVKGIEILDCIERFDQITQPAWRAQFIGKRYGGNLEMNKPGGVESISGTTLSSIHITEGVRRLLTVYAQVISPPAR